MLKYAKNTLIQKIRINSNTIIEIRNNVLHQLLLKLIHKYININ